MKKLFQKLLSPKEEREKTKYEFQPTQQQTPSPLIVRSPPAIAKDEAKKKKEAEKKQREEKKKVMNTFPGGVRQVFCKDFEIEDHDVDLDAILQEEIDIPSDLQKTIVATILEDNPLLFDLLALVCREWRATVFSFFETKRNNKTISDLENACYWSLLMDSRFSSSPSPLLQTTEFKELYNHPVSNYFLLKRNIEKHSWGRKYEDVKLSVRHCKKSTLQNVELLTIPEGMVNFKTSTVENEADQITSVVKAENTEDSKIFKIVNLLSSCTIKTEIWEEPYELRLSSIQYSILSLFEDKDLISLESLSPKLNLHNSMIEPHLQSLVAIRILNYENYAITLNPNFESETKFINCMTRHPSFKGEILLKQGKYDEENKLKVQACMVRTMKAFRTKTRDALFKEVTNQLRTNYSKKYLNKQVETLLEREYFEEKDGVLMYLP